MFKKLDVASRVILLVTGILLGAFAIERSTASQASCVMPTSGTVSGLTLVNDINACNGALLSLYSGAGAPSSPTPGMFWYNTTSNFIQQYDSASWINVWYVDSTNHLATAPIGGGSPTASIASATTTDLGTLPQSFKSISGTATITSFGSSATPGTMHVLKFTGAATLTHNATSLILPGGLNITAANKDIAFAMYLGSGNWQVLNYSPASGAAVSNPALPIGTQLYGDFVSGAPAKTVYGRGQAIARSSYPDYLAVVTRAQSMTRTASNATLTSVADTSGFGVGNPVEGPGISVGCTIASFVANTSITLNNSTCVTASGSASITVFPTGYGSGGDSTTIGVKDCRGRSPIGTDEGTGRLTTSYFGAGPNSLNSAGNSSEFTRLTAALVPDLTTSGTITVSAGGNGFVPTVGSGGSYGLSSINTGSFYYPFNASSTWAYVSSFSGTGQTMTTTGTGGSNPAHRTVSPVVTSFCVVAVLP